MGSVCNASTGVRHSAQAQPVTTFPTASRARLRRARPGRAWPIACEDAEVTGRNRKLARREPPGPSGVAEGRTCSGAAACRALRAGAHRARRCLRSAAPAPAGSRYSHQRASGDRACKTRPGRPPRAGHSVAAQRSPSRALAALASFGWRYAPLLTVILPGKSRHLSGGRRECRRVRYFRVHIDNHVARKPVLKRILVTISVLRFMQVSVNFAQRHPVLDHCPVT